MDKTAIEKIQTTAVAAARLLDTAVQAPGFDRPVVALPSDLIVHDLERFMHQRARFRGTFSTSNVDAFAEYIEAQDEAPACFVDGDEMQAEAIFDLGTREKPLHAQHRANLIMVRTAPFSALLHLSGTTLGQRSMAEWIEDWRDFLQPVNADENKIEIVKAIAAVRSLTVEEKRARAYEEGDHHVKRTAMEELEAKGARETLPVFLDFSCIPYEGLKERTFRVRVGVSNSRGESAPSFTARIVRQEREIEEVALEFRDALKRKFTGMDVNTYFGTFSG